MCLTCVCDGVDVVEKLEEEFSVLRDCEARVEFTEEMRASRQVSSLTTWFAEQHYLLL